MKGTSSAKREITIKENSGKGRNTALIVASQKGVTKFGGKATRKCDSGRAGVKEGS